MTCTQRNILKRLHDAGVTLKIEDDRLRYRCLAGAMTPDLRADLAVWKPDLVYEYHERAGILEYDACLSRPEAERQSHNMLNGGTA